jgi:hypothetical protein
MRRPCAESNDKEVLNNLKFAQRTIDDEVKVIPKSVGKLLLPNLPL